MTTKDLAELEQAAKSYRQKNRPWEPDEIEAVRRYYKRVPIDLLCKKLARTERAIQLKARLACNKN